MFTDEEKRIFRYEFRGEVKYADPLRIKRLLQIATDGNFDNLVDDQRGSDEVKKAVANGILAESTAAAFEFTLVDPDTGEGATEDEAIDLLRDFLTWIEKKNMSGGTSPMSAT